MKFHLSTSHEIGTAPCANINGLEIFDNSGDSGFSSYIIKALNIVKQSHIANPNAESVVSIISVMGFCGTACADNPVIKTTAYMYALGILFSVATGNNYNADACLYFSAASPLLLSRA